MAGLTDRITDTRNAARPNSARVNSPRSSGASTLSCDNLTGWPTASKVHFVTYKLNSSSDVVAGSQLDCYGIVSGNSIGSFTVVDGTDTGHAVNDVVEMLPTAAWGQDLADALNAQHNRTGTHKSITTDTITTTGNASVGGALAVTGAVTHSGAVTNSSTTTLTGAVGGAGYDVKTIANSYKFSVYLAADQSISSTTVTKCLLDTKIFDTSTNFDIATNHRFTAPIAGFYQISAQIGLSSAGTGTVSTEGYLYKNGAEFIRSTEIIGSGGGTIINRPSFNRLIQLAANDYIELFGIIGEGGRTFAGGSTLSFMTGFLVSAT